MFLAFGFILTTTGFSTGINARRHTQPISPSHEEKDKYEDLQSSAVDSSFRHVCRTGWLPASRSSDFHSATCRPACPPLNLRLRLPRRIRI